MDKKQGKAKYFDYPLLIIILALLAFGLVMLYSTSYYSGMMQYDDPAYFLKKQLFASVLGLIVFVICIFFDYRLYYKMAPFIYIIMVISVLLILTPLGKTVNGARRWINLKVITFQPAELCKLGLIIALACFMVYVGKGINKIRNAVIVGILIAIPTAMILFITKNLSSAIIIAGIGCIMYFVATKKYWPYVVLAVIAVGAVMAFMWYVNEYVDPVTSSRVDEIDAEANYRMRRVLAWRYPENYADTTGYQTLQALYALGSGGLLGKGLGQSIQKLGFIPEAQNDMIFSVVCEELGLFGGFCLIMLFVLMIWRFMKIALHAQDLMGAMLVVGVMAHIAVQVILNIAVVTNTIPNTGITLPFISYGGTSILFLLAEMGIVLNVSRHIKKETM